MENNSCKERLLQQGFKGLYNGELPTNDKEMFIFLMGIMLTDFVFKTTKQVVRLERKLNSEILKKRGNSIESRRAKIIKNCHTLIEEYICEVKGVKRTSRKYSQWFKEMNHKYEENKEEWSVLAREKGIEFINLINSILIKEFIEKK